MDYSDKEFRTMQEEALRRVQQMHKRSRDMVGEAEQIPDTVFAKPPKEPKLFDFSSIKLDEEKVIIGLLIYVLYKQGADTKLLLALGYLLL